MRTGRRQIGLEAVLAVIRLPDAKPARGNKSRAKVEISPVGRPRAVAWEIGRAVEASVTGGQEPAQRIAPLAPAWGPVGPIASAAAIFRAVAQETGTPSVAVPGDSTDPPLAATAAVAPPAWGLAAEASIVVAEAPEGAGSVVAVEASEGAVIVVEAVVAVEAVGAGKRRGS